VVSEIYDEVVFTDPSESFFQRLVDVRYAPSVEAKYSQHMHFKTFSDTVDVHALLEAEKFLQQQLRDAKERLKSVDEDLEQVDEDLAAAREQQQQQRAIAADTSSTNKATPKPANKNKAVTAPASAGLTAKKTKQK
jgi:Fe2+ transport system protein B